MKFDFYFEFFCDIDCNESGRKYCFCYPDTTKIIKPILKKDDFILEETHRFNQTNIRRSKIKRCLENNLTDTEYIQISFRHVDNYNGFHSFFGQKLKNSIIDWNNFQQKSWDIFNPNFFNQTSGPKPCEIIA